jgi:hypothetical protein
MLLTGRLKVDINITAAITTTIIIYFSSLQLTAPFLAGETDNHFIYLYFM